MLDVLFGEHFAHIRPAGGVTDHGGATADQGNGLVPRHLQPLHQSQGHKMTGGQAVGGAVKANVENRLAAVDHFPDLFLVGDLGNQPPGLQFFVHSHCVSVLSKNVIFENAPGGSVGKKKSPLHFHAEGDKIHYRGTTSIYHGLTARDLRGTFMP